MMFNKNQTRNYSQNVGRSYLSSLLWLIVGGWGLNNMRQGKNYQDFLKWRGGCF